MTIVAPYRNTMRGAKRLIGSETPTPRRDRVIALAQRWNREHALAMKPKPGKHPTALIEQVAFWHGIQPHLILGDSRVPAIVEARFDAVAAVAVNCKIAGRAMRLTEIGRVFNRDHTTIISALSKRGL